MVIFSVLEQNCVMCHEQCSGCTGPTNRDYVMCREDSIVHSQRRLVCVPQCQGNTFLSPESGVTDARSVTLNAMAVEAVQIQTA